MFHSRFLRRLFFVLLVPFSISAPVSAQGSYNLPKDREPITADNAAKVVELAALKGPGALEGASSSIAGIALSQDGSLLAFGTYSDKAIHLVELATGKEVGLLQGHTTAVTDLVFSPDGSLLASAGTTNLPPGRDTSIRLWDMKTKKQRTVLQNNGGVGGLEFSSDGKMFAFSVIPRAAPGSNPPTQVIVADAKTPAKRKTLNKVFYSSFSSDAKLLASGSRDKLVHLWDVATGKEIKTFSGHTEIVLATAFSADGKLLASGGSDATVRLWDVAAGKELRMIQTHTGIAGVAFSPDGKLLASIENGFGVPKKGNNTISMNFNPKEQVVALWDTETGTSMITLKEEEAIKGVFGGGTSIGGMTFSADWSLIATAGGNGIIRLWGIAKK